MRPKELSLNISRDWSKLLHTTRTYHSTKRLVGLNVHPFPLLKDGLSAPTQILLEKKLFQQQCKLHVHKFYVMLSQQKNVSIWLIRWLVHVLYSPTIPRRGAVGPRLEVL